MLGILLPQIKEQIAMCMSESSSIVINEKIKALRQENGDLKEKVEKLRVRIDDLDSIRVEIVYAYPDIRISMGLNFSINEIDRTHRIGPVCKKAPRQIIVKFTSYRFRRIVIKARSSLRNSPSTKFKDNDENIHKNYHT